MRKFLFSFLFIFSVFNIHAMEQDSGSEQDQPVKESSYREQDSDSIFISHNQISHFLKRNGFDLNAYWKRAFDRDNQNSSVNSKGFGVTKKIKQIIEEIFDNYADQFFTQKIAKKDFHSVFLNKIFKTDNLDNYKKAELEKNYLFLDTLDNDVLCTENVDYEDGDDGINLAQFFRALGSSVAEYFNIEHLRSRLKQAHAKGIADKENLLRMPLLYIRAIKYEDRLDIDSFPETLQSKLHPLSKREIVTPRPPRSLKEKLWLAGQCALVLGVVGTVGYLLSPIFSSWINGLFCKKGETATRSGYDDSDCLVCDDPNLTLEEHHQCLIDSQHEHGNFLGQVVTDHQELTAIIQEHCGDTPVRECLQGLTKNAVYVAKYSQVCGKEGNPDACVQELKRIGFDRYNQICPNEPNPAVCAQALVDQGYKQYQQICQGDESPAQCEARIRGEGYAKYRQICPKDESPETCDARIRNEGFQAYCTICPSDDSPEECEARIRGEASADYKRLCPNDTNPDACATRLHNEGYTLVCNNEEAAQDCILRHEKNGRNDICFANETREDCADRYNQMMQACPEDLSDKECIQLVNACVDESIDRHRIDAIVKSIGRSRSRGQGYRDNNRLCATGEDLKDLLSPEEIIDFTGGNENGEVCTTEEWINNKFGDRAGGIINRIRSLVSRN